MKGFDTKFSDFPDYIIGITKEIWEDRGIAPCTTITRLISSFALLHRWWWETKM